MLSAAEFTVHQPDDQNFQYDTAVAEFTAVTTDHDAEPRL